MSSFRSRIIRLAYDKPFLRKPLIRILTAATKTALTYNTQHVGKHIRLSWNFNILKVEELPGEVTPRRLRVFHLFTDKEVKQGFDGYLIHNILVSADVNEDLSYDMAVSRIKRKLQDLSLEYQSQTPISHSFVEQNLHYLNVPPRDIKLVTVQGHDFTLTSLPYEFEATYFGTTPSDHNVSQMKLISSNIGSAFRLYKLLKARPQSTHSVSWEYLPDWLNARNVAYDLIQVSELPPII